MIASPVGPTPRFRRAAGAFAAVFLVLIVGFALPGRAEAPCGSTLCWIPRGNFAGLEFTSLVSPPGNPCVVAWTALSNGGLGVSTDCGEEYARLLRPAPRAGGPRLTSRAREVLQHLLRGASEKGIAAALSISRETVHGYVKAIYAAHGVSSRAELLACCLGPSPLGDSRA